MAALCRPSPPPGRWVFQALAKPKALPMLQGYCSKRSKCMDLDHVSMLISIAGEVRARCFTCTQ